ncbi:MAG: 1-acyl-sn-glycerol-3-phosphate acyltransferase [Bacteroidales bacterium]|jgi:1-acyl-sn-glycerol-3-phosphate acyltransferase|nr:1-acyl-sn-glycerol-3-phosphate acyltransferase [Bacteroidales bacterium]
MSRYSKGYAFVRTIVVLPVFRLFYRRIQVIGHPVPKGPVIFAPNHQNSLMDAICILCTCNRQPVFVARADIFRGNGFIIRILHFLRILPIYRKRDGVNTEENNRDTFDILLKTLHNNRAAGIMPEGTYSRLKRLQQLQKGIFRIAMKAQEKYGNRPYIKIIPVGLEYSDIRKFRSDVIIRYGKPMEMSDYYGLYAENPSKAFKQMQTALSDRMKEGMIHIENDTCYNEINWARRIFEKEALRQLALKNDGEGRLIAQQHLVAALEAMATHHLEEMAGLSADIREYAALLDRFRFRDWVVRQPYSPVALLWRALLLLAGTPVWLMGMLFNYPPYKLSEWVSRLPKDSQFFSSVQYVGGIVFFPLYHLTLAALSVIFIPCLPGKICLILLLLPTGLFSFIWYLSFKKLTANLRFRLQPKERSVRMVQLRKTILEKIGLSEQ